MSDFLFIEFSIYLSFDMIINLINFGHFIIWNASKYFSIYLSVFDSNLDQFIPIVMNIGTFCFTNCKMFFPYLRSEQKNGTLTHSS